MKVGISRFFVVAVITGLLLVAGSTTAWADTCTDASPNFSSNFASGPACLTLNYNAHIFSNSSSVLRLTDATGSQVGSAWFNTPQPVQNGFSTSFQFQFTNPSGTPADGIAFVIQNAPVVGEGSSSTGGLHAIGFTGGNGGALGYGDRDANGNPSTGEGIPNSIAIEFDSYQNGGWDNDAHHVAVQSCGNGPNTSHHGYLCGGTAVLTQLSAAARSSPRTSELGSIK